MKKTKQKKDKEVKRAKKDPRAKAASAPANQEDPKKAGKIFRKKFGKKAQQNAAPATAPAAVLTPVPVPIPEQKRRKKCFEKLPKWLGWIKKLTKKQIIAIATVIAVILVCVVPPLTKSIRTKKTYRNAVTAIEKGQYEKARTSFEALGDYKDARVLRTYALSREIYTDGQATTGTVLDQVTICLSAIPESYSGDLAEDIRTFKTQFGYYSNYQRKYNEETAFLRGESSSGISRADVKHNGNFYQAFEAFYESAAHFWDEETD